MDLNEPDGQLSVHFALQVDAPLPKLFNPAPHGTHPLPGVNIVPFGHDTHCFFEVANGVNAREPCGQLIQLSAPIGLYDTAAFLSSLSSFSHEHFTTFVPHFLHMPFHLAPTCLVDVPGGHFVHSSAFTDDPYEPFGQFIHPVPIGFRPRKHGFVI